MKILLPPSEGKTPPSFGPKLELGALSFPQLSPAREQLIAELIKISGRPDALEILGVGKSVASTVRAQRELLSQPCAPAIELYTGVLYKALALSACDDGAAAGTQLRASAQDQLLIFSGLFGVTKPLDLIPDYRLAMGVALPQAGKLSALWHSELKAIALAGAELVVDCRSGAYRVWDPPNDADWVEVTAVREQAGKRKVISHMAKHYRGLLAGALLRADNPPQDGDELAAFAASQLQSAGITAAELSARIPAKKPRPRQLTLVLED